MPTQIQGNKVVQLVQFQPQMGKWNATVSSTVMSVQWGAGEAFVKFVNGSRAGLKSVSSFGAVDISHKYLYVYDARANSEITTIHILSYYNQDFVVEKCTYTTEWQRFAQIGKPRGNSNVNGFMCIQWSPLPIGAELQLKNFFLFDLTEAFGEGNEPSTPDDFAHRLGFPSINDLPYIEPSREFPNTPLAFQLASLIAYANETTGAGDTLLGDAVKTLVEGYGQGDLVFYDKLVSDGIAYINLNVTPSVDAKYLVEFDRRPDGNGYIFGNTTDDFWNKFYLKQDLWLCPFIGPGGAYHLDSGVGTTGGKRICVVFNSGAARIVNITDIVNTTGNIENTITVAYGGSKDSMGQPMHLFGVYRSDNKTNIGNVVQSIYHYSIIGNDGEAVMDLRPCTYHGEAGMWDVVTSTFFGNANSIGAFSVAND